MAKNGIELFNRGTQGLNKVVSGALEKPKATLKYPHGSYPAAKYVEISVYSGDLAASIQGITDGVSQIQGALQDKLGEIGGAVISGNAASVGSAVSNSGSAAMALGNGIVSIIGGAASSFQQTVGALGTGHLGNGSVANHAKTIVTSMFLPLPNEIQESMSHSYDEEAGWFGTVKPHIPGVTKGIDTVVDMASIISKMSGSRSITFDRNRVSMYTESAFRSVNLSWNLVPNDAAESKAIHDIVKTLKKYSSPASVSGKILLKSPHFFRVKFGNKLMDEALQFYEVVITDIGIDYSPGGGMEMNYDDTPKTVSLSITFKDREPKLMEDWSKAPPRASTGSTPSCTSGSATTGATGPGSSVSTQTAGAGGGANSAANTGIPQAPEPEMLDEDWRNGTIDADDISVDWGKSTVDAPNTQNQEGPSVINTITKSPIDLSDKLPAESPYAGDFNSFA